MPWRTTPEIRVAEPIALGTEPDVRRERAHLFPAEGEGHWQGITLLVLFAFVPLILSRPGRLVLDTDDRLFVDPGGALADAAERWNPISSFGSVRDKTFDPAFPMSPWFWFADGIGLPDWLAQRLWVGAIVLAAGLGFVFLLRTMSWTGRGWMLGALTYQCSPYLLSHAGSTSGVLLAWAGLPWIVGFTSRSLARKNWHNPARCAVVVAIVASANVPAALYLSIAPVAFIAYAVMGARTVAWRDALETAMRIGVLSLLVSVWWVTGFVIRSGDALRDIRGNDPVELVGEASTVSEITRGLGDWRLYSNDPAVAIASGDGLQSSPWMIGLGFVVPAIALSALVRTRFPNRLYFMTLLAFGAIFAVGPHVQGDGEPVALAMRRLADEGVGSLTNPGRRALPLMWLGIAIGIAAAVRRLCELAPRSSGTIRVAIGGAVLVGVLPFVTGGAVDGARALPDGIPQHWRDAAALVNGMESDKNILELPGMPRLGYTWGSTNRPISFALFDRPVGLLSPGAASEPGTAEVLTELDRRIQRGDIAPRDVAPLARLFAVDTIVVRGDGLDDAERAARVRALLNEADDVELVGSFGSTQSGAPAVAVYEVSRVPEPVRAVTPDHLVAMSGSASGVIDLVQSNLLSGSDDQLVVSMPEVVLDDLRDRLGDGVPFVLTDSVRPEIDVDGTTRGAPAADDGTGGAGSTSVPSGSPNEPADPGASTIEWDGIDGITARPPPDEPADPGRRPALAMDGDPSTAWTVGGGRSPVGAMITIDLGSPRRLTSIRLRQPGTATASRLITSVRVYTDLQIGDPVPLDASLRRDGQVIAIDDEDEITSVTIQILSVEEGSPNLGAGFSEIEIPGVEAREIVRLPNDLERLSPDLGGRPVTVTLSRWTTGTATAQDPETRIDRRFSLPTSARYSVRAIARGILGTGCHDDLIVLDGQPVSVRSAERLSARLVELESCNGPLTLDDGDHELRTLRSATAALERVTLAPEPLDLEPLPPVALDVNPERRTSLTIDVPENTPAFWLVRTVSKDAGWEVTLDDAVVDDLRTANGFAFAVPLVLEPTAHKLAVRWTPQRPVNVAALVSAAGLLLAIGLAIRRPRRGTTMTPPGPLRAETLRYVHPLVVVTVSLGLFGLSAGPVPGIVAGLVALLLEQRPHLFNLVAWTPGVLVIGAGVARAVWQVTVAPEPGPTWPGGVPVLDMVVWTALALAVAIAYTNSDTRPGSGIR